MAPEIRCNDVVFIPESLGDPIPVMAVILISMDQQHWRSASISPIQVVQSHALRKVSMRRRAGFGVLWIHREFPLHCSLNLWGAEYSTVSLLGCYNRDDINNPVI
jgi:hypothetical protein